MGCCFAPRIDSSGRQGGVMVGPRQKAGSDGPRVSPEPLYGRAACVDQRHGISYAADRRYCWRTVHSFRPFFDRQRPER